MKPNREAELFYTLSDLVRKYLYETRWVPMRAIDCDQDVVEDLENKIYEILRYSSKENEFDV